MKQPPGSTATTNGQLVARQPLLGQPFDATQPPPFARTTDEHIVATLTTPDGPATVIAAPSATDGLCAWIDLDGADTPIYGDQGCLPTQLHARRRHIPLYPQPRQHHLHRHRCRDLRTHHPPTSERHNRHHHPHNRRPALFYSLPAAIAANALKVTVTAYHADGAVAFSDPVQP